MLWSIEQALRSNMQHRFAYWVRPIIAMQSYAKFNWPLPIRVSPRCCSLLRRISPVLPASLRIQIDGYRQVKIIKQRVGDKVRRFHYQWMRCC